MNARLMMIVCLLAWFSLTPAAERKEQERYWAIPIKGDYYMYGGTISEMLPPTDKDRKVSFMLNGLLAKDLFNQIGPDAKHACSTAAGYRERRRGDLVCILDEGGYSCYFGLNVITGKSVNGIIC